MSGYTPYFVRAARAHANQKVGIKLRFEGAVDRLIDADEPTEDEVIPYIDLVDALHTMTALGHESVELVEEDAFKLAGDRSVDLSDDEPLVVPDDEPRGLFAQFCTMSGFNQQVMMTKVSRMICELIGVSYLDWEPSEVFVLDYIQDETPESILREMAYAHYLATPQPNEENPSDEDEKNEDLVDYEGNMRPAQQGGYAKNNSLRRSRQETKNEYVDHEIGERKADRTCSRASNARRRACFYSARRETMRRNWDLYNEDPIEIDAIEQDAAWEAMLALDTDTDPEPTAVMPSTWSPVLPWDAFDEEELAEMAEEMHQWVTTGYRPRSWVRRSMFDDDWYDPYHGLGFDDYWDDYYDSMYDEPAHAMTCNCNECLAERFARSDDHCGDPMCSHCNSANDIFAGYGEDDRSIDEQYFAQSSGKRGMSRRSATSAKAERRA